MVRTQDSNIAAFYFIRFTGFFDLTYKEISIYDNEEKALFIIPTFTASAYSENAFYDYFSGNCDNSCLTVKIVSEDKLNYNSSANAVKILRLLGYDSITDLELHENPNILNNYDKVILLHNEYISKKCLTQLHLIVT